jgi:hypothetical protein
VRDRSGIGSTWRPDGRPSKNWRRSQSNCPRSTTCASTAADTAISTAPGSATIRVPSFTTSSPRLIQSLYRTSPGGSLGISRESLSSSAAPGLPLTMTESCSRLSWRVELAAPTCLPSTRRRWNRGPEPSCRTMCLAASTALFSRRPQRERHLKTHRTVTVRFAAGPLPRWAPHAATAGLRPWSTSRTPAMIRLRSGKT